MKELVSSVSTEPLLDREKIEAASIKFAQIAPEVIRIITPKNLLLENHTVKLFDKI